jgi:hypothetical protein
LAGVVTARWACGPAGGRIPDWMKKISYAEYRFPLEIIHQAIWLYLRFTLSFRDVEDLLAERGLAVSYERRAACAISLTSCPDSEERTGIRFEKERVYGYSGGAKALPGRPLAPAIAPIRGLRR